MRRNAPSTSDEIIDSRDVIARLEELTEERDDLQTSVDEATEAMEEASEEEKEQAENELDAAVERLDEWNDDNGDELKALQKLNDEAEGYSPDWAYGATLIREDHFTDYCQELVSDIGDMPREIPSYIVIDWDATAENIKADYTEVDFDGTTYLVR